MVNHTFQHFSSVPNHHTGTDLMCKGALKVAEIIVRGAGVMNMPMSDKWVSCRPLPLKNEIYWVKGSPQSHGKEIN